MGLENSPAQEHLPAFAKVMSTAVIITVSACEESQGLKGEKRMALALECIKLSGI